MKNSQQRMLIFGLGLAVFAVFCGFLAYRLSPRSDASFLHNLDSLVFFNTVTFFCFISMVGILIYFLVQKMAGKKKS